MMQVVAARADLVFDLRRVAQRLDLVAVALEQRLHVVADGSIVVDDKNANGGELDGQGILLGWVNGPDGGPVSITVLL